jgi:hypothetical protein
MAADDQPTVVGRAVNDRTTIIHVVLWLTFFVLFFIYHELIALLLFVILVVFSLCALIRAVWCRMPRRASSALAGPLLAILLVNALPRVGMTSERIRFLLDRPWLEGQVNLIPDQNDEPKLAIFNMGDTGCAVCATVLDFVVFDESDEIAKSEEQRSQDWRNRAARVNGGHSSFFSLVDAQTYPYGALVRSFHHGVFVQSLGDHWFWVTEIYQ